MVANAIAKTVIWRFAVSQDFKDRGGDFGGNVGTDFCGNAEGRIIIGFRVGSNGGKQSKIAETEDIADAILKTVEESRTGEADYSQPDRSEERRVGKEC